MNSIHATLALGLTIADVRPLPREYMTKIGKAFDSRIAELPEHLKDTDGMKRIDWLLEDMFFSALVDDAESDPDQLILLCTPIH